MIPYCGKWVYVCCTDPSIGNLADVSIKTFNNQIWEHNLKASDFEKITTRGGTNFWTLVGRAWSNMNYHRPETVNEVLNQRISWNSHIRVGNLPLSPHKHWPDRIRDITANNVVLAPAEMQFKYPKLSWLDCLTIYTAIPASWKEMLQYGDTSEIPRININELLKIKPKLVTKTCYRTMNC